MTHASLPGFPRLIHILNFGHNVDSLDVAGIMTLSGGIGVGAVGRRSPPPGEAVTETPPADNRNGKRGVNHHYPQSDDAEYQQQRNPDRDQDKDAGDQCDLPPDLAHPGDSLADYGLQ